MNSRGKGVHVDVGQFVRLVVRTVVAVHTARGQHFRRSYIWSPAEAKAEVAVQSLAITDLISTVRYSKGT